MTITNKLTLLFTGLVAIIILLSASAIYYFTAEFRKQDFQERLNNKGENIAKLLIKVEEIDNELLKKIEKDNPLTLPKEQITIFDYKNRILFKSGESIIANPDSSIIDKIRLNGSVFYQVGKNDVVGFLYADRYERFVVWVTAQDIYGYRKLSNLRNVLISVFFSCIIIVLMAGRIFASRAMNPIQKVIDQVETISAYSLDKRLNEGNGQDEIARLSHTFNNMLGRLESAFKVQKTFIANASHELRTPLAIIRGQLEVLLQKDRDTEEYRDTIQSVLLDISALNQTSNRLLLLAQASSETTEQSFVPIRLDESIWQARSEVLKRNDNYVILVKFEALDNLLETCYVAGNELLLKTAFLNLFENACKYSDDNTANIVLNKQNNHFTIQVIDNGIGIEMKDQKNIFQPFYRGDNTGTKHGHGIGLSLAEKIILSHKGTLSFTSLVNKGTTFLVELPSA
jgi:signal transduction histidine kinase